MSKSASWATRAATVDTLVANAAERKTRVFISYSRKDSTFAETLMSALNKRGIEAYLDTKDILPGEPWKERLGGLILSADAVAFLISPDSMTSEIVAWEVGETERLQKRLLPVVHRDVPDADLPPRLSRLHYVFVRAGDDFAVGLDKLCSAIDTDIPWIRQHTRMGELAHRWEEAGRPSTGGRLMRGEELAEAEKWLLTRPKSGPEPAESQRAYVQASRAFETAEFDRIRRFQRRSGWALTSLAVLVGAGIVAAGMQLRLASQQTAQVLTSLSARDVANGFHDRAMRIAIYGLPTDDSITLLSPRSHGLESTLAGAAIVSRLKARLSGHGTVDHAIFSHQSDRILTIENYGRAVLWDASSGAAIEELEDRAYGAEFSSDGTLIVISREAIGASLWDAKKGKKIADLGASEGSTFNARFSPDGARVLSVSARSAATLWDVASRSEIAVLKVSVTDGLRKDLHADFSKDGSRILLQAEGAPPHLVDGVTGVEIAILKGHEGKVLSAQFSLDGSQILTGSSDKTARLWDAKDGTQLAVLAGHESAVYRPQFSPNGRRAVTVSNRVARLWDVGSGTLVAVLKSAEKMVGDVVFSADGSHILTVLDGGSGAVWESDRGSFVAALEGVNQGLDGSCRKFSPDGLRILTSSWGGAVYLWDALNGRRIATLDGHVGPPRCEFSSDGTRVVSYADDRSVQLWDGRRGTRLAVLNGHDGKVTSAAFSPDGADILTTSEDHTARLWNGRRGLEVATLDGHNEAPESTFSPDGRILLTRSSDGAARLWQTDSGRLIASVGSGLGHATGVFSPDSSRLVLSNDGLRLYNALSGTVIAILAGPEQQTESIAFNRDGSRILTTSKDYLPRLWDGAEGKAVATLGHVGMYALEAAFSPDGLRVVTSSPNARLWDARTGAQMANFEDAGSAEFSSDSKWIVTGRGDHTAVVWDAKTGAKSDVLEGGHIGQLKNASFSVDGSKILTTAFHDGPVLWDSRTKKKLAPLWGEGAMADDAAFSPDGRRVLTFSNSEVVGLWDAQNGTLIATFRGSRAPPVHYCAFALNSSRFLVKDGDKTVRVLDAGDGTEIARLKGHLREVNTAVFSPDGERIATVSDDKTVRLWDAETGTQIAVMASHEGEVRRAIFSPEGKRLVSGSSDQTAKLWDTGWIGEHGQTLLDGICRNKLKGAQALTSDDVRDPILASLSGVNPCSRHGPLSWQYWRDVAVVAWHRSFATKP